MAPNNGFAKPSDAPAGGDSWSLTDGDEPKSGKNDGKLFVLTPLRKEMVKTEKYGEKEVIVADVTELDPINPALSVDHDATYVWGGYLQGALRGYIGTDRVLGRLAKTDDASSGRGYVWKLEDATDRDMAVANAWSNSKLDPFGNTGASSDDEPKKAKKDKKKKDKSDD